MLTRNGDKDGVEDEESCFGGFGDHRVRHEKVHLFIFFQVILVIQIPYIVIVKMALHSIEQSLDIEHCGEEIHLCCVFPI